MKLKNLIKAHCPLQGFPSPIPAKQAAVLIAIINHTNEPTILFTQRTAHLKHHPGQFSFPGGKHHVEDKNLQVTALRETHEEIGLNKEQIEIIGQLPSGIASSAYQVTPFIGWIETPPTNYQLQESEVEKLIEVPVDFVFDKSNHKVEQKEFQGKMREYYSFTYETHYIWGLTAGFIVDLSQRLRKN